MNIINSDTFQAGFWLAYTALAMVAGHIYGSLIIVAWRASVRVWRSLSYRRYASMHMLRVGRWQLTLIDKKPKCATADRIATPRKSASVFQAWNVASRAAYREWCNYTVNQRAIVATQSDYAAWDADSTMSLADFELLLAALDQNATAPATNSKMSGLLANAPRGALRREPRIIPIVAMR